MFSGIVEAVGRIETVTPLTDGVRICVDPGTLDREDIKLGDSIAHGGVCLTVVDQEGGRLSFDVSRETLNCTVGLDQPGEINLEKALRVHDRLGGHIVTGHVDGIGKVMKFEPIGESHELVIEAPADLAGFIARKGSITVDGVSLTVNQVTGRRFWINLIPHTIAVTTLKRLAPGARVNLEIDILARYMERLLAYQRDPEA
ncbi:MAG: riboflavin synthase [Zoogloeaceae bacterium]|nr:riboflavin synthase [Zoogloeaceae bacterium]